MTRDFVFVKDVLDYGCMDQEIAQQQILKAIEGLGQDMHGLKEDVHGLKEDVHVLKEDVHGLKEDVHILKEDVHVLKEDVHGLGEAIQGLASHVDERFNQVFTKNELTDVLDDKLGTLKGDLIHLTRQEDKKVIALVHVLRKKEMLTYEEAKQIFAMDPFPNSL